MSNAWPDTTRFRREDWQAFGRLFAAAFTGLAKRQEEHVTERLRLVDHVESLGFATPEEAARIRQRIKASPVTPAKPPRQRTPRRFPSEGARARWTDDNFDAIWMHRLPFLLYPNGSFRLGRPG